jgi:hypothetical protein
MKCENCGIFIKSRTHPRYPNVVGLCLFDNCTTRIPYHLILNKDEKCQWGVEKEEKNESKKC